MDIREIIHRLRAAESKRRIAREMQLNWRTVKKYAEWAESEHLLAGPLPPVEALQQRFAAAFPETVAPQMSSSVTAYREQVVQLRQEGAEIAAIFRRLSKDYEHKP